MYTAFFITTSFDFLIRRTSLPLDHEDHHAEIIWLVHNLTQLFYLPFLITPQKELELSNWSITMSSEEFEKLHEIYRSLYEELKRMPERLLRSHGGAKYIPNSTVLYLSNTFEWNIDNLCVFLHPQRRKRACWGPSTRGKRRRRKLWATLIVFGNVS